VLVKCWPLAVVGAGPAGVAAAAEAARQGVRPLLLDSSGHAGGTIRLAHEVRNIPFLNDGVGGEEVAAHIASFLDRWDLAVQDGHVTRVGVAGNSIQIETREGGSYLADRVILALGTRALRPAIEGLEGRMAGSAAEACTSEVPRSALVIGGSDVAMDQARWLRARGCEVEVLSRGALRAPAWLVQSARREGVVVSTSSRVIAGVGDDTLRIRRGDRESVMSVDAVVAAVGRQPLEVTGFRDVMSQRPGSVRIAGDGKGRRARHVVAALGDGCVAAAELLAHPRGEG
jgi:thioredoxin reductase (NADPH)